MKIFPVDLGFLIIAQYIVITESELNTDNAMPCGQRLSPNGSVLPSRRLVNGRNTTIHDWPWMVALLLNGKIVCGGSLVTRDSIVTAAHCLIDPNVSHWEAILGHDKPNAFSVGTKILSFTKHPLFVDNAPTFNKPCDNDIAIVKLATYLKFHTSTFPICLLPQGSVFNFKRNCHVTGWGRSSAKGPQSSTLQEIIVDIVPTEVCNKKISYNGVIHNHSICAGPEAGGRGPCQFDSGGPLACEDNGLWYLTGIVSYGIGCALPYKYGVYSNMFQLTSWTRKQLMIHWGGG